MRRGAWRALTGLVTGLLAVCQPAHAEKQRPMTFEIIEQRSSPDGVTASIYASGDITDGTARRFEEMVAGARIRNAVVSFDSRGGLVVESVRLGQAIRRLGFGTSVQRAMAIGGAGKAYCASACVYAYAGGVARYLNDADGRLGVHQYYASSGGTESASDELKVAQLMGSVIVAHLQQMGVSSALYVAAAMTDSGTMLWMDRSHGEEYGLVNNGRMAPEANIRLTDSGHPYLVISQIADRGETSIAISCSGPDITVTAEATGDRDALRRVRTQAVRSRFEIDGTGLAASDMQDGLDALSGEGVGTTARIDMPTLARFDRAGRLGFSVDDVSGSWRREIDVRTLRDKIAYYTRTCGPRG